jgi:hypothetical protein
VKARRASGASVFAQFQTWTPLGAGAGAGPLVLGQVAAAHDYLLAYLALVLVNAIAAPLLLPWLRGSKSSKWSADESEQTEGSPV